MDPKTPVLKIQITINLKMLKTLLFVPLIAANIWDNLWSNNQANRVVFPSQFELKLSWNAGGAQKRVNSTNYV